MKRSLNSDDQQFHQDQQNKQSPLIGGNRNIHNLVVIGTDGIGSSKSNYHQITAMTVPRPNYSVA
jgi:transcription initiation factor TFIID subunit TAF12